MNDSLFFKNLNITESYAENITNNALYKKDDGELYLEYKESEHLQLDDNKIKILGFNVTNGFGLRSIEGEKTTYIHASEISEKKLKEASELIKMSSNKYKNNITCSFKFFKNYFIHTRSSIY